MQSPPSQDPQAPQAPQPVPPALQSFDPVIKFCHWTTVLLVMTLFGLGWYMTGRPLSPATASLYNWHKSLGLVVLLLTLFRLFWRLRHPQPSLPAHLPAWERQAARISHFLLYSFLILQPLSGIVMAQASGLPTLLFDVFPLPMTGVENKSLMAAAWTVHFYSSWTLLAVIAVHVGAALRHHFILKNTILRRMLPGRL